AKNSYSFTSATQFRLGDSTSTRIVTFSGIEQGVVQCGSGDDTIDVSAANIALSIFANDGNDAVRVANCTLPVNVSTGSEHASITGFPAGDSLSVGFILGTATVIVDH